MCIEDDIKRYLTNKAMEMDAGYLKARDEKRGIDAARMQGQRWAYSDALRYVMDLYRGLRNEPREKLV